MRFIFGSLSFLCCLVGFRSPSSRLSFFSSSPLQALGKHKPRSGLWFPLCCPGHAPRLRPVHLRLPIHQGIPPAPVVFFCFFSSSRRWWWGLVCLGVGGPLSLSLSLSLSAVRLAMHVCLLPRERGGGLPDGAPSYDHNCLGFFREMSMGQCPGRSVQNCPCSPHFLPQPSKTEAGRGSGGATVLSDKCFCTTGGPYCHANDWCSSPLTKGEMLSVFFICVFCGLVFVLCRFFWQSSLLLRAGFCDKFSGANFCFCFLFGSLCF